MSKRDLLSARKISVKPRNGTEEADAWLKSFALSDKDNIIIVTHGKINL